MAERAEQWQTATEPKSKAAPQASGLRSQSFFEPSPEADHIVGRVERLSIGSEHRAVGHPSGEGKSVGKHAFGRTALRPGVLTNTFPVRY